MKKYFLNQKQKMKTKTVTLKIPKDQRLGQAIMNAYRDEWYRSAMNPEGYKYWSIFEEDTDDIQNSINEYFKDE